MREKKKYTFEFKRSAVECYLSTEASYQDVALLFGMNSPTLLARWTKEYLTGGMDALRPKPKGRPPAEREQIILAIRKEHKDYWYRRLWAQIRNPGYTINHEAVQRIVQKLELQVHFFTRKSRRYSSYRGSVGTVADRHRRQRGFKQHLKRRFASRQTVPTAALFIPIKGGHIR